MHLLRKFSMLMLVCAVLLSLWLVAADRGVTAPTALRPDGTFIYEAVASRDDHRPRVTDDAAGVMRMVRTLVSG